jgi:hypothetical protein
MRYEITIIDKGGAKLPQLRRRRSSYRMKKARPGRGEWGQAGPGRVTITVDFNDGKVQIEVSEND